MSIFSSSSRSKELQRSVSEAHLLEEQRSEDSSHIGSGTRSQEETTISMVRGRPLTGLGSSPRALPLKILLHCDFPVPTEDSPPWNQQSHPCLAVLVRQRNRQLQTPRGVRTNCGLHQPTRSSPRVGQEQRLHSTTKEISLRDYQSTLGPPRNLGDYLNQTRSLLPSPTRSLAPAETAPWRTHG